ncbi:hypothetical protein LCGC14_1879620 [marine sediment metagenome]|uniref:PhoU domain-containing protein n=1 Tax=marine sediment metagenome TaxID=412755 RepID=A0A0F9IGQ0_9ZZZZ
MFKNLLGFGKGKDFITEVIEEFNGMLNDTQTIFVSSYGHLFNPINEPGLGDRIYEIDRRVNEAQKKIRKRIAEHLTCQPTVDTMVCLILMSLVKDAERVGDLAKNIYESKNYFDGHVDKATYDKYFGDIDKHILEHFNRTRDAFIDSDEEKAAGAWDVHKKIREMCDNALDAVANSDMPVKHAVAFSLMTRYYKRISAHLTNIATSVVVPLEKLDYFECDAASDE